MSDRTERLIHAWLNGDITQDQLLAAVELEKLDRRERRGLWTPYNDRPQSIRRDFLRFWWCLWFAPPIERTAARITLLVVVSCVIAFYALVIAP